MAAKAGWYTEKELGEGHLRYWNGTKWTEERTQTRKAKKVKAGTAPPPYKEQEPWNYIFLGVLFGTVISAYFFNLASNAKPDGNAELYLFLGGSALLTGYTYALIGVIGAGVRLGMRTWDFDSQRMDRYKGERAGKR